MSDVTWILVVVSVCGYVTFGVSMDEVPEFQYPCYVDVCTFPRQFCNSDRHERRCSPCSRAICDSKRVPTACQYICIKYKEAENKTPKPSVTTSTTKAPFSQAAFEPQDESTTGSDKDFSSLYYLMGYSAIAVTILVIGCVVFVASYIFFKRQKQDKQSVLQRKQDSFKSAIEVDDPEFQSMKYSELNEVKQRLLQPQHHCSTCRCGEGAQSTCPPSYSTADLQSRAVGAVTQTDPSLSSDQSVVVPAARTDQTPCAAGSSTIHVRQSIITNPTGDGNQRNHEKMMANGRLTCESETNTESPSHSGRRSIMKQNSGDSDQTSLKHQT